MTRSRAYTVNTVIPAFLGLLLTVTLPLAAQRPTLRLPLAGEPGRDFFMVNYVDHDSAENAIRDYRCGSKTYDGHQGTDFTLRSFAQMDSGVPVLAAADGVVIGVVDSLFDRNKESVPERGFGNWIGVVHEGNIYTYYAHIRTGSARVLIGDTVRAGDTIAQVGSSGNSTDPHVHFEAWTADGTLLDPFGAGPCNPDGTILWAAEPAYDTAYHLIDHGLIGWEPTLDTLREHPPTRGTFSADDQVVTFWAHQRGLREGDVLSMEWRRRSDDLLWFEYTFPAEIRDWWYHYFWSFIDTPPEGEYLVRYRINGSVIVEREFSVGSISGIDDSRSGTDQAPGVHVRSVAGMRNVLEIVPATDGDTGPISATLFNMRGERVAVPLRRQHIPLTRRIDLNDLRLPNGPYRLLIQTGRGRISVPVHILQP